MPKRTAQPRRIVYAKSADTRARILAAALEEASDSGIHQTGLAAIAARAGVAIGSLNYHFGSREELLRELMASLTAGLMERLHAADAEEDADFFERERAGLLVYLDHLRANPAYLRLAAEVALHEPELYRRVTADWLDRIASRLHAGIARGDLRPMTNAEISAHAYFILGAHRFLDHRTRRDGRSYPGDGAVVDAWLALLRGGLGRQPGARRVCGRQTNAAKARRVARVQPTSRSRRARP
jgi:AcrR family transcriptional regulator